MNKWMALAFGALLVLSVLVLVLAIGNHTEPTFAGPERWGHVPLTVSCSEHCAAPEEAVAAINRRLGFEMLQWQPEHPDADIQVAMRTAFTVGSGEPGGKARRIMADGRLTKCSVSVLPQNPDTDLEWLVVYHELGHCMGLAHDCYLQSIMCGGACCSLESTAMGSLPSWISDADRRALRQAYSAE